MTECKFEGMTRGQYDANMKSITDLCRPQFRKIAGLNPDGTPDIMAMLDKAKRKGTAFGIPEFGAMYRPPERSKTGLRERARRVRQMRRGLDDVTYCRGGY